MSEEHMMRMTEQIGELNGTVKSMTASMDRFIEMNQAMHDKNAACCSDNKVEIGKINARHGTYWKIIGSFGGLGGLLALFKGIKL